MGDGIKDAAMREERDWLCSYCLYLKAHGWKVEVELQECDLCGIRQNKYHDPRMEERIYIETVSGNHGHDYLRDTKYHLCPTCQKRVGMMVQALRARRESGRQKTWYTELLKVLDALLEEQR